MATLLEIHAHYDGTLASNAELRLNYDARQKSRFRATLSNGREVGVFLPRGRGLRDGDLLEVNDGSVVVVDVPDTAKNRTWMKAYKARWKERLEQLELWMVSYPIDIE